MPSVVKHFHRTITRSKPPCILVPLNAHFFFTVSILHLCPKASGDKCLSTKSHSINAAAPLQPENLIILVGSASLARLCILMDGKWKTIPHLRTKRVQSPGCLEVVGHNSLRKLLSSGSWQNPAVFFTQKPLVPSQRQSFVNLHCIQMPLWL